MIFELRWLLKINRLNDGNGKLHYDNEIIHLRMYIIYSLYAYYTIIVSVIISLVPTARPLCVGSGDETMLLCQLYSQESGACIVDLINQSGITK